MSAWYAYAEREFAVLISGPWVLDSTGRGWVTAFYL